jgi:hypothetical protein
MPTVEGQLERMSDHLAEVPWLFGRIADALERIEIHVHRLADEMQNNVALLREHHAELIAHHDWLQATKPPSGPPA